MTTARHLSLVPTDAKVIPLPRRTTIRHNALRHAVLRQAANGIITRSGTHVAIDGHPISPTTRAAIDDLADADLIGWFPLDGKGWSGHVGWITQAGAKQLAEWDGPRLGGDAA